MSTDPTYCPICYMPLEITNGGFSKRCTYCGWTDDDWINEVEEWL